MTLTSWQHLSTSDDGEAEAVFLAARGSPDVGGKSFRGIVSSLQVMFVKSELWSSKMMNVIATACIVLHNVVVEVGRDGYGCDDTARSSILFDEDADRTDMTFERSSEVATEAHLLGLTHVSDDIQSMPEHESCRACVVSTGRGYLVVVSHSLVSSHARLRFAS
jgi:Plant transposon protein